MAEVGAGRLTLAASRARRPRREAPLGPGEYALLGLLAVRGGSGYGYDLARHFGERSGPLGEIIRLEPGMLYHHLKKLARDRLVTTTVEEQSGRPARQTHAITEAGRGALDRWLREPVRATREIRLDFLLKLFFARQLNPPLARSLVADQRRVCDDLAASLTAQIAGLDAGAAATDAFTRQILDLRLAQTRAASDWLADISRDLGS